MRLPQTPQRALQIGGKRAVWRVEQLPSRDRDDVHGRAAGLAGEGRTLRTKQRPQPPFSAIARDRATDTPRRDHAEAIALERVRQSDERQEARAHAASFALDADELLAASKTDARTERLGHRPLTKR